VLLGSLEKTCGELLNTLESLAAVGRRGEANVGNWLEKNLARWSAYRAVVVCGTVEGSLEGLGAAARQV